jgi:hypothetical protein
MSRARRRAGALVSALVLLVAAGCVADDDPSATPTATPALTPTGAPAQPASPTATAGTPEPTATATPEPTLALDLPEGRDDRRVSVAVTAEVPPDADGRISISVTSAADTMIDELVLRWSDALHEVLFPAPFAPSPDRIRDGGPPLVQPWTKWVLGPGERGEPAGTVSLGYGPLPARGTLEIPLFVTRRAPGAVAFDLQVLAGEDLLALDNGEPAVLRVEVP